MTTDFLIDGYNLLHAAGLARATYGPGGLERARHHLLLMLASHLTPDERLRTTVVFDAKQAIIAAPRHEGLRGIRVLYSGQHSEADDLIEELIAAHSSPKQLIVVSGDRRLLKAARARRAPAMDSHAFLDELQRRSAGRDAPHDTPPRPDPKAGDDQPAGEIAHWLQVFGELDTTAISKEIANVPAAPRNRESAQTGQTPEPSAADGSGPAGDAVPPAAGVNAAQPAAMDDERDMPPAPDRAAELAFWEARIAELLRRGQQP